MTFNIRLNTTSDGPNMWDNRKELVVAYSMSPDLIGMQEVLSSQLDYLTEKMYWFSYYGVGRDDGAFSGEAVPIFYNKDRFSLLDKGTFWLSPTPKIPGSVGWDAALTRICSWVKLSEKSTGFQFYFLNTHFDHMGDTARTESAKIILDFINTETENLPVILTGDFNCSPEEDPYSVFTAKGAGLTDACMIAGTEEELREGTFNGFGTEQNPERIDMVFYKGRWEATAYEVLKIKDGEMFISDHWPIVVKLGKK
jgi:endonuclease/exonuclease/phosphatase family metal-dependent hydrolase